MQVSRREALNARETVSLTVEELPQYFPNHQAHRLALGDFRLVAQWIRLNKGLLLALDGEETDFETFLERVKPVEK